MTLKLNGSSSGYTAIDAPASGGNRNITFPDSDGTVALTSTSGKVLQMKYVLVPADNANEQNLTSFSYTALTKPELTITPAASGNLILLMTDIYFSIGNDDEDVENSLDFQVLRTQSGLSDVPVVSYAHNHTVSTDITVGGKWLNFAGKICTKTVDTTVNANAITYKCHARLDHDADTCRFHMGNTYSGTTGSSMIAMEFEP